MDRDQRREALGASRSKPQLKGYAFTVSGHALVDGMVGRSENEVILAYPPQNLTLVKALDKMKEAGLKDTEIYQNTNSYTEREILREEAGTRRYGVVGYALRDRLQDEKIKLKDKNAPKQMPVGDHLADNIYVWDSDNPPILVVAKVVEEEPNGTTLHALLRPDRGLCTPYVIKQDLVFYRHEFRDGTTNKKVRGRNWNRLVLAQTVRPNSNNVDTAKQTKFKRARNSNKIILSPHLSLANEFLCLARGFQKTKKSWFLTEMQLVLKEVDNDLNYAPIQKDLRNFIDSEEEFNKEEAEDFIDRFSERWPEVQDLTVPRIMTLRKGLLAVENETDVPLEYFQLRSFIAEGVYRLSKNIPDDENLKEFVEELIGTTRRMMPLSKSAPPISCTDDSFEAIIRAKLKEVVKADQTFGKRLKELNGDVTFEYDGTPYDIWSHYADQTDTDAARTVVMQLSRYISAAHRHKDDGLGAMVRQIIQVLDHLEMDGE